jgi:hypothetical protein
MTFNAILEIADVLVQIPFNDLCLIKNPDSVFRLPGFGRGPGWE